jgi:hypothetical protein
MRGIGRPREADRSRGSRFRDRCAKRSRLDAVSPYVLAELAGFPSPLTACRESRSAEKVDDAATGAGVTVVGVVAGVTVPAVAITVSWPVRHRLGRPAGTVARRTAFHLAGMPGLAGMRSRFAVPLGRSVEVGVQSRPIGPGPPGDLARPDEGQVSRMTGGPPRPGSGMEYRTRRSHLWRHRVARNFALPHALDATYGSSAMNPWRPHELSP